MKVFVVYDDTGKKSEVISDIIGEKGFGDVVVKKQCLETYYRKSLEKALPIVSWRKIHSPFEYADLKNEIEHSLVANDTAVLHCFSNYLISDEEKANLSFEKLLYIDEVFVAKDKNRTVAVLFPNGDSYIPFCNELIEGKKAWDAAKETEKYFEIEGVIDIGRIENFIQCVTGNFDSRFFNSLSGDDYTIIKSSRNKDKIKSEYMYYHLLPDDMKYWFVMPFDFWETEETAGYSMERLHMTDLAIKWVHGSIEEKEFEKILDLYFYFFKKRHQKNCSKERYRDISDALFVKKVENRINDFKNSSNYAVIRDLLNVTKTVSIDSLVSEYFSLKEKIESKNTYPEICVIGHGDSCFSNALYNKSTRMLKFIDPKGALSEDELWTNPYYDIAKLSHSICGNYDFFNNGLYEIRVTEEFTYQLDIPFDNTKYVEIFKRKLTENGYDYLSVRLYEASLFLSMLPLHIDNPHKVFGFILNVYNILKEIKQYV